VSDLAADPRVASVQPNYTYARQSSDPDFNSLWGLRNTGQFIGANTQANGISDLDIDAPEAWGRTTGDEALKVAVIDTGVQIKHPDLAPNVWTNPGESGLDSSSRDKATNRIDDDGNGLIDDVRGWDFVNDDNSVYDGEDCGGFNNDDHGTHVSGTIAGANNSIGIVGVAPNVSIIPLKIIPCTNGETSDVINALAYAKDKGARIANMSLGGPGFDPALKSAIDSSGLLVVAAAGNGDFGTFNFGFGLPSRCFSGDGDPVSQCPMYPAAFPSSNIISVAAVTNRGVLASFSAYGSTGPGGTTATGVDIAAPGQDVLSSVPFGYGASARYGVAYFSGTSMAAPHVSGIAALLMSAEPSLTGSEVKARILARGKALSALGSGRTVTGRLAHAAGTLGMTRIQTTYSSTLITYGSATTVRGRLTAGATVAGRPMELRRYVPATRTWVTQCRVTTASDGVAACSVKPSAKTVYEWRFPGSTGLFGSWSGRSTVQVRARVGLKVSDATPRRGQLTVFTASVAPNHAGRSVDLQRLTGSGWRTVRSAQLFSTSVRTFSITPTQRGTTTWRVSFRGDADHAAGASPAVSIKTW
jgi:subtilisin family serine protease